MFLTYRHCGDDRDGQQITSGRFLLLVQPAGDATIAMRALVRFASMQPFGNFMMGTCRAFGHKITLSGTYGNNGLPCHVPQEVYDRASEVPAELIAAWNTGDGGNGAGSEGTAMREWAIKTFVKRRPSSSVCSADRSR